ncbi:MAG: hypothetical protein GY804_06015 [Alphaproteobacteria bacterium]|nr:hypothetical protein [Alphaproteobacteria bacterium]
MINKVLKQSFSIHYTITPHPFGEVILSPKARYNSNTPTKTTLTLITGNKCMVLFELLKKILRYLKVRNIFKKNINKPKNNINAKDVKNSSINCQKIQIEKNAFMSSITAKNEIQIYGNVIFRSSVKAPKILIDRDLTFFSTAEGDEIEINGNVSAKSTVKGKTKVMVNQHITDNSLVKGNIITIKEDVNYSSIKGQIIEIGISMKKSSVKGEEIHIGRDVSSKSKIEGKNIQICGDAFDSSIEGKNEVHIKGWVTDNSSITGKEIHINGATSNSLIKGDEDIHIGGDARSKSTIAGNNIHIRGGVKDSPSIKGDKIHIGKTIFNSSIEGNELYFGGDIRTNTTIKGREIKIKQDVWDSTIQFEESITIEGKIKKSTIYKKRNGFKISYNTIKEINGKNFEKNLFPIATSNLSIAKKIKNLAHTN